MNIFINNTRTVKENLTNLCIYEKLSKDTFKNFYF